MAHTTRTLVLAITASGVLGGAIGALATDATQSEASPAAMVAAVQKVQDTVADTALKQISSKLTIIGDDDLAVGIQRPAWSCSTSARTRAR